MNKVIIKSIRLSDELAARIDAARGDVSWSRWVQRAIENELEQAPIRVAGTERTQEVAPLSSTAAHVTAARHAEFRRPHLPTCGCAVCKPPK